MKKHDRGYDLTQDFDYLAYPSQVFDQPEDVVNDPYLSLNEKRAILAAWASDACAIEAAPALRKTSSGRIVKFEEIMAALRLLDKDYILATRSRQDTRALRSVARRGSSGRGDQGAPLQ
jgi:hypothetical protein